VKTSDDRARDDRARDDHVEDLLEAYAEARLMPTGPVLARIRATVLAEAAAAAAERRRLDVLVSMPRFGAPQRQLPRRAFALGFAAVLTLGTTAAVMAAPPGSPFYNARVYIETIALPSQPDNRLAARERHLETRIQEAEAAATRGDGVALAAALAAYQAEMDAAVAELGADLALLAHLEAMLNKHVAVLEALEARLPEQASLDKALDASQKAVEKIKEKGGNGGGRPSDPPGGPPENPSRP
jgi:hypothetical protein